MPPLSRRRFGRGGGRRPRRRRAPRCACWSGIDAVMHADLGGTDAGGYRGDRRIWADIGGTGGYGRRYRCWTLRDRPASRRGCARAQRRRRERPAAPRRGEESAAPRRRSGAGGWRGGGGGKVYAPALRCAPGGCSTLCSLSTYLPTCLPTFLLFSHSPSLTPARHPRRARREARLALLIGKILVKASSTASSSALRQDRSARSPEEHKGSPTRVIYSDKKMRGSSCAKFSELA